MFITLENLRVHYKVSGSGEPIILIHGWGSNIYCFAKMQEHLSRNFMVYVLDLPGFGLSTLPGAVWGSVDYANLIKFFINELKIANPILLGHSLGGKIVVNLVAQGSVAVKRMILIGSSGLILPKSLNILARIYFFKLLKFLLVLPIIKSVFVSQIELYRKRFGSRDYRSASGIMRAILVKTVNENIIELLPRIKIPTLLLWGDQDLETPPQAGKILHEAILGSQLKIISGSGHFPFLDNWEMVKIELDSFLK